MNDTFLRACRGNAVEQIPVWFMRQAGRSLPGYRKLRKKYDVLTLTQTSELAAKVSLEPVERYSVDAAILFADIMLLPIAMGIEVKIVDGIGPIIDEPIRSNTDIKKLMPFESGRVAHLQRTIQILRNELSVPLIGFSGAPFTLASYLIEGQPTRTWTKTKHLMFQEPKLWNTLMKKLSDGIIGYLRAQIEAGVQAVQIFDSWVGCLSPFQYQTQVLPHMKRIFKALGSTMAPRIHFGTNTAGFLDEFSSVECEVVSIDWRIRLADAKKRVRGKSLQGNLDPMALLAPWRELRKMVDDMLSHINPKKGFIFNLGHGMPPEADDEIVKKLVQYVHSK